MVNIRFIPLDRYAKMELCFFITVFIALPTLYNLEHLLKFNGRIPILPNIPTYLYRGIMDFLLCMGYYWLVLKRLIFAERWVPVVVSALLFSVVKSAYEKYVTTWLASQIPFFDAFVRNGESQRFKLIGIHIDFAYAMNANFLIMVGCAYVIKSIKQKEQLEAIKNQQLLSELIYLKAQLHPHFFFNTLNNIYGLAVKQSKGTAPMIAHLADMMRYIIYKADAAKVPLEQEIDFIRNYVAIERIRHTKEVQINFEVQGDISNEHIEPLLFLPLVENAFKHGLNGDDPEAFVNIILCLIDNEIHLEIDNSIPGNAEANLTDGGLGLSNLRKRLVLLYPEQYSFQYKRENGTYHTTLRLMLK